MLTYDMNIQISEVQMKKQNKKHPQPRTQSTFYTIYKMVKAPDGQGILGF